MFESRNNYFRVRLLRRVFPEDFPATAFEMNDWYVKINVPNLKAHKKPLKRSKELEVKVASRYMWLSLCM